ncbi:MAG: PIN domain-containing protein [Nanoarchaeota archaeon]
MDEIFFFDLYALLEIVKGGEKYKHFTESDMVTSRLNLFELYYILLRDTDERTALLALDKYYDFSIDFDIATIQDASKMKLTYKRRNLSMADCVGYCLAGQLGIPFLTGDCQFRDMPNVQFVT